MINRRDMIAAGLGTFAYSAIAQVEKPLVPVSVAVFSFAIRLRAESAGQKPMYLSEPVNYLEFCRGLGAGGIQVGYGIREQSEMTALRRRADEYGMFIEGSIALPKTKDDVERFDKEVQTATYAGVNYFRTVMLSGRRYETFDSMKQYEDFKHESFHWLELAEPICAKHKVHVCFENHKDWRIPEMLDILKRIDSEWIGACVDTGNNISLLEMPMDYISAFAPYAHGCHLKDAGYEEYEDGFLLADCALGEGSLDVPKIVETLKKANPKMNISMEMSTRDPLKIPVFTDKYWTTFGDVKGEELAKILRMVRDNKPEKPYPRISEMTLDDQIAAEEGNIRRSIEYARKNFMHLL
jgi:sugar phosphate isomerase/epimerase